MVRRLLRYLVFAFVLAASAAPAFAARKVALVIGNSAYRHQDKLENPANDAADMSAALGRLGFEVEKLLDADGAAMRRALVAFGERTRGAEFAVIFFAGHGIEIAEENYLIPVDARLASDTDAGDEAISLRSAMLRVANATKLGMVILDSCRNNPFKRQMARSIRTRNSVEQGLKGVDPPGSVLVAYAAKEGTLADEGVGSRNSPFTTALLQHLETPGLEINFVFRRARDAVVAATARRQEPHVYGSLSGAEIYLKPAPAAVAPAPAAPGPIMAPPAPAPAPVVALANPPPAAAAAPATVQPVPAPISTAAETRVADALAAARLVSSPAYRAYAHAVVAAHLHRAGQIAAAKPLFDEATAGFRAAPDRDEVAWHTSSLASMLARAGRTEEALALARSAAKVDVREASLASIAFQLADKGLADDALALADGIAGPQSRLRARLYAAEGFAKAGQAARSRSIFDSAVADIRRFEPASDRDSLMSSLATSLARAGRIPEALDLVAAFSSPVYQRFDYVAIARLVARDGRRGEALASFAKASAVVREKSLASYRASDLADIVQALDEAGFRPEALDLLREARRLADETADIGDYVRVSLHRAQLRVDLDDDARATAAVIKDAMWTQFAMSNLAVATARRGDGRNALRIAGEIKDNARRDSTYGSMISELLRGL